MANLNYNEILPRKYIILNNEPYEVLDSHIFRKQQRKPVNQTKLKNLVSGKVMERSFHQSEKTEEAELEKQEMVFIYQRGPEYWFHQADDKSQRFSVSSEIIGEPSRFLSEGLTVTALVFQNEIIGVELPIKVELEVTEAPPGDKGNTAQGGTKQIKLKSGTAINAPLFIKEGDVVRVNTQTGEYTERAS